MYVRTIHCLAQDREMVIARSVTQTHKNVSWINSINFDLEVYRCLIIQRDQVAKIRTSHKIQG